MPSAVFQGVVGQSAFKMPFPVTPATPVTVYVDGVLASHTIKDVDVTLTTPLAAAAVVEVRGGFVDEVPTVRPLAENLTLTAGTGTVAAEEVTGGSLLVTITATAWNSASIKVQYRTKSGIWLDAMTAAGVTASLTADGTTNVVVGSISALRLLATGGNPAGVTAWVS